MANKLKMFRNTNQTQRFRFVVLVIGCLVVSMTFIMISRPLAFPSFGSKIRRAGSSDVEGEKIAPAPRDDDQSSKESEKYQEENDLQGKKVDSITDPNKDEKTETDEAFESTSETEEEGTKNGGNSDQDESHSRMTLPTISNYTINDLAQVENKTTTPEQPVQEIRNNVENTLSFGKKGKLERLNQRASHLADRLCGASVDELVMVPSNIGFHWILTVIDLTMKLFICWIL